MLLASEAVQAQVWVKPALNRNEYSSSCSHQRLGWQMTASSAGSEWMSGSRLCILMAVTLTSRVPGLITGCVTRLFWQGSKSIAVSLAKYMCYTTIWNTTPFCFRQTTNKAAGHRLFTYK